MSRKLMSAQKFKWLPFWKLEREETFHLGKTCYVKLWFIFAVTCVGEQYRAVMPWTRVKTTRPYGPLVLNDRSKDGIP